MPANYTVVEASKLRDKPDKGHGPMQDIALTLRNEGGREMAGITWYAKATTPVPTVGAVVFGDVTKTDYGWQFKKARTGPPGGFSGAGRDFKADPVKQAAIAMEAAQKTSVEIVRIWRENWNDDVSLDDLTAYVKLTAAKLFEQIQAEMKAAE